MTTLPVKVMFPSESRRSRLARSIIPTPLPKSRNARSSIVLPAI
ncbi:MULTISPECIES: hypothetical protein [unclassified Chamaesiphon]|nr:MULTISPECIES: hypothetical protein [unclassified Chamaesiphon]